MNSVLKELQSNREMRIALDAMGGDFAPEEIIKGAHIAVKKKNVRIFLVGNQQILERELNALNITDEKLQIRGAEDIIKEGEHPAIAVMQRPNASVNVAAKIVKSGEADAMVSMGSTGAVMVSAMKAFGMMEGIERPIVGGPFLGFAPNTTVADLGANVDCKPRHLLGFALMGCVVARTLFGVANPTVALLSVGAEEGKGNNLVREAFPLLKNSGLNFIGNVEGNDIVNGKANVILCDGFVGNILVKFCEALGTTISHYLDASLKSYLSAVEINRITEELMTKTNYADSMGGGPIWGVNGVAIVGHGRAKADEVAKAITLAKIVVENNLIPEMQKELQKFRRLLTPNEKPD